MELPLKNDDFLLKNGRLFCDLSYEERMTDEEELFLSDLTEPGPRQALTYTVRPRSLSPPLPSLRTHSRRPAPLPCLWHL